MASSKKTLVQRIALDGGKDIEKELKELGDVGEAAFAKLKDSADKVKDAGTGLNAFFGKLRSDLTTINAGAKQVAAGFNTIGGALRDFAKDAAIAAAAAGAAATALFLLTKSASDAVDEQNKAAQSAGLTIKEYGRLQFAFEQGNVAADDFAAAMKPFNKAITAAAKGTGPAAAVFKQFGVSVLDANGKVRSTEDILASLADGFAKVPDSAAKSAAALTLFGRAGARVIPILDDGGTELKRLGDRAEVVGRVFTVAQAQTGDAFSDALNELTSSIKGIRTQIGLLLAPAFTGAFTGLTKLITDNKTAILALGQSIVDKVLPFIQDFINIISGNDAGVVNKSLLSIRDTILNIGTAAQIIGQVLQFLFDSLVNAIQPIVDLINSLFGTKFRADVAVVVVILGVVTGLFRTLRLVVLGVVEVIQGLGIIFGTATAAVTAIIGAVLLLQGALRTVVNNIVKSLGGAVGAIGTMFTDLAKLITDNFQGMVDAVLGFFTRIIDGAKAVIAAVAGALGAGQGGGDTKAPGFAAGGQIRGSGTGTSDSILARVSNGEFIMRAKAVRKWGSDFMRAINAGHMPSFATGGLVRSLPSFAGGGAVTAGGGATRPFNLIIGDAIFEGLMAPDAVADKFSTYAATRSSRRTGKSPSWKM